MNILSRSDWGARKGRSLGHVADTTYTGIEVHHSVTGFAVAVVAAVKGIQNYHLDKKRWRDIFYNFLIHADGTVVEGRGWNTLSDRRPVLTVCFLGNYENDRPTEAQKAAFQELRHEFLERSPRAIAVTLHDDRAATACPGTHLRGWLESMNATGWPPPAPEPKPEPPVVNPDFSALLVIRSRADATVTRLENALSAAKRSLRAIDDLINKKEPS